MAAPVIHTYHCICSSLLLATTHNLSSLPRRASPSLDEAIILPLPSTTPSFDEDSDNDGSDNNGSDNNGSDNNGSDNNGSDNNGSDLESERSAVGDKNSNRNEASLVGTRVPPLPDTGYTVLLSTAVAAKPTIIRRSDGFEKRYLLRCGRCRLVVGYELDDAHFGNIGGRATEGSGEDIGQKNIEGDAAGLMNLDTPQGSKHDSKRTKLLYLLPAGIMSTEIMAAGKRISEVDIGLGEREGQTAVAAWEDA